MVLVRNNYKSIIGICLPEGAIISLLPGINDVEADILEKAKSHPNFPARAANEMIQIIPEKKDLDGKICLADMLNNIPKMTDKKLLKKIIDNDGREKVIKSASEQLSKIVDPEKFKAENNDEHFC